MVILTPKERHPSQAWSNTKRRRWESMRHDFMTAAQHSTAPLALFGSSIVAGLSRYPEVWNIFKNVAENFGVGGDRCEHVLWRITHGQVPAQARYVFVCIGSNNLQSNNPADIVDTIDKIIRVILDMNKTAIVHGLLPRDDRYSGRKWDRRLAIKNINAMLQCLCHSLGVKFIMPSNMFTDSLGGIVARHYDHDRLHLNASGNRIFANDIVDAVEIGSAMMGRPNPVLDSYALGRFESI